MVFKPTVYDTRQANVCELSNLGQEIAFLIRNRNRNRNRNLEISRAPHKSPAQGISLFKNTEIKIVSESGDSQTDR